MTITICVTSDLHGRMDRLQQLAPMIKQQQPDLLIDNGDFLQGSLLSYYVEHVKPQPHPMLKLANELGYDCAVFGNHEFNYPLEHVEAMRKACKFPWISANIEQFAKPYVLKDVRGQRVAIIGVTTHFTPRWDEQNFTQSLTFSDALEAATYWVQYVHEHEGCDYIIVSYHGGFYQDVTSDAMFAPNNGENQANDILKIPHVDALITGHQHLQIATLVNGIPVLQPGANGACFGVITLSEKPSCQLIHNPSQETHYPEDVSNWLQTTIGHCPHDFTYTGLLASRIHKPRFVDFLHDVVLSAVDADLSVVELMFHEQGGFTGDVTNEDVLQNIHRPNTLNVLELTGADILAALEQSAAVFAVNDAGDIDFSYNVHWHEPQPYHYDYWGGMSYDIFVGQPVGQRVHNVMVNDKPLVSTATYRVAMNSYRATGTDFPAFANKRCVQQTTSLFPSLILQHIKNNGFQDVQFGTINVTV